MVLKRRKPPAEVKRKNIVVRVTDAFYAKAEQRAAALGHESVSSYVRQLITTDLAPKGGRR